MHVVGVGGSIFPFLSVIKNEPEELKIEYHRLAVPRLDHDKVPFENEFEGKKQKKETKKEKKRLDQKVSSQAVFTSYHPINGESYSPTAEMGCAV